MKWVLADIQRLCCAESIFLVRRNVSCNAGLCAWPQLWRNSAVAWNGTLPITCAGNAGERLARANVGLPNPNAAAPIAPVYPSSDTSGLQGTLQVRLAQSSSHRSDTHL